MIEITFRSKDTGSILRTETFKAKKYEAVLKKCKEFNDDVNESVYVYTVSNLASNPRHTTGLTFKAKFIKPVKLVGKEHSVLGSDPFNCDYLIPLENENG